MCLKLAENVLQTLDYTLIDHFQEILSTEGFEGKCIKKLHFLQFFF